MIASVPWFALAFVITMVGFESSEFEKSWPRWLSDMTEVIPYWGALVIFGGGSIAFNRRGKVVIAAVISLMSLAAFVYVWQSLWHRAF